MWEMGGYGCFIWSSYGIVFAGLIWLTFNNLKKAKITRRQIRESE